MNELLIVDIESILQKKEPEFFFIERTLKDYKMGIHSIQPMLFPADYKQAYDTRQYAVYDLKQGRSLVRQTGIYFQLGNLHQYSKDDPTSDSTYLNLALKGYTNKWVSEYDGDQMIVSEYQDEYVRIIHDQSPSSSFVDYPNVDFMYIYSKDTPTSGYGLFKTILSDSYLGKNRMMYKM